MLPLIWAKLRLSIRFLSILCQAYRRFIGFLLEIHEKLLISRLLRLSETTRSHLRKVLGQPELPMLLIKENSDPDDGAAGGQDILAMTIIGCVFVHHGLVQA